MIKGEESCWYWVPDPDPAETAPEGPDTGSTPEEGLEEARERIERLRALLRACITFREENGRRDLWIRPTYAVPLEIRAAIAQEVLGQ